MCSCASIPEPLPVVSGTLVCAFIVPALQAAPGASDCSDGAVRCIPVNPRERRPYRRVRSSCVSKLVRQHLQEEAVVPPAVRPALV
jgi:hypothetical protein